MATKVIAVTGATGSQGSGVVNIMKKTPGWKVRAITRNPESATAKKLANEGIEVVQASFDNQASLAKAFDGVHAIFAVTNWWEQLFAGSSRDEAGVIEEAHGMNIARAAANTPTLEHYIWSSTPCAKRHVPPLFLENGEQLLTPHMDYKANVDARIKNELPELATKTTYLYCGYYPQNMAFFPLLKPVEYPGSGKYVQTLATKPSASVLVSGDMSVNPGIWVRQIIATAPRSFGKYANVALEFLTFQEMLDMWSQVMCKPAVLVETTAESWTQLWGFAATEIAAQFKFGELCDPWEENNGEGREYISAEKLGIREDEVVGFKATIDGLKHLF